MPMAFIQCAHTAPTLSHAHTARDRTALPSGVPSRPIETRAVPVRAALRSNPMHPTHAGVPSTERPKALYLTLPLLYLFFFSFLRGKIYKHGTLILSTLHKARAAPNHWAPRRGKWESRARNCFSPINTHKRSTTPFTFLIEREKEKAVSFHVSTSKRA